MVVPARHAVLTVVLSMSWFAIAAGHAKMKSPVPRGGPIDGFGTKLRPFENASITANGLDGGDGCGGEKNGDPGAGEPKAYYYPGQKVKVKWSITIPHNNDRKDTGVRIALNYGPEDGFAKNVLAGGIGLNHGPEYETVDAGENEEEELEVTIPEGKTCKACTLQWIWAARRDGGYYLGCSDIAIAEKPSVRRRRGGGKGGKGKGGGSTKWCPKSPEQNCAKKCKKPKCKKSQCALREGTCCSYKCQETKSESRRRNLRRPVPWCPDSEEQTCKKKCKPAKCSKKQCALREGTCCDYKCQDQEKPTKPEKPTKEPEKPTKEPRDETPVKWCPKSPEQLCRKECKKPMCSKGQCALRANECCEYKCQDAE